MELVKLYLKNKDFDKLYELLISINKILDIAYQDSDAISIAMVSNQFESIYKDVIIMHKDNKDNKEYLKLHALCEAMSILIYMYFGSKYYKFDEETMYGLYDTGRYFSYQAGLIPNRYSGKYIYEEE